MIYLDYAAATPMDPQVLKAMQPFYQEYFYNPSANYLAAKQVREHIETARQAVAKVLGARPGELVFTAGGTEANNLAIHGIMQQYPGAQLVISAIEHDSIRAPSRDYMVNEAGVKADGVLALEKLEQVITAQTVLISIMYANNEIGTIEPIAQVAALVKRIRTERLEQGITLPLYLHTDACQAPNYLPVSVSRLGVDMMTINSGKLYGPKQCGALYVKSSVKLKPQILGGGQERGLRSGTENPAAIVGFATALTLASELRTTETQRLSELQKLFITKLQQKLPQAQLNGNPNRLANNVHITIPGTDNERVLFGLDEAGIQCAVGSACSASKAEPSHVLRAIGLSNESARSSLRFSLGRDTNTLAITKTINVLTKLVA